jgi:hypothetical protein
MMDAMTYEVAPVENIGWMSEAHRLSLGATRGGRRLRLQIAPSVPTVRAFGDRGKIAAVQADIAEFHIGAMIQLLDLGHSPVTCHQGSAETSDPRAQSRNPLSSLNPMAGSRKRFM